MDHFRELLIKENPRDFDEDYYQFLNNLTYENLSDDQKEELKLLDNPSASSPLKRKKEDECDQEIDKRKVVATDKGKQVEDDSKGKKMEIEEDSQEKDLGEFGLTASEGELLRNIFRAYEDKLPPLVKEVHGEDMEVDGKM